MNAAIFSFFGVVVGALLQYFFTRHLDSQRHQRELKAKAYTDYLRCVSEHANFSAHQNSPEGRDLTTRTADAKCRICLYASPVTIGNFAKFERLGAAMNTTEQRQAFTEMVATMRTDSSTGGRAMTEDLEVVLLGTR